jgi:HEAT repeat protein
VIFYCPSCWREVTEGTQVCPACGKNVEHLSSGRDYVQKLIGALDHPEPTTPIRAAWVLGMRKEARAVPRLIRLVRESTDPYIVEAAVEALAQIGDPAGLAAVRFAAEQGPLRVRERARHALDSAG